MKESGSIIVGANILSKSGSPNICGNPPKICAKTGVPNQRPLPHELTSNKSNFPFHVLYEVSIAVFLGGG